MLVIIELLVQKKLLKFVRNDFSPHPHAVLSYIPFVPCTQWCFFSVCFYSVVILLFFSFSLSLLSSSLQNMPHAKAHRYFASSL